ncbi:MAG: DNA-directed RNA polymerase subunit omega [Clostridia bacterium]|nr:DNA-directed RNA polymerase subunit omega [Clostridia bacterium]
MIYPPIDQLVKKTGNKYELVIATAKRARVIANEEKAKEKQPVEQSGFMSVKTKTEKPVQKPIVKAINDILDGKVYIAKDGESFKTQGFENVTVIGEALMSGEDEE